jgi:hypothetical protein
MPPDPPAEAQEPRRRKQPIQREHILQEMLFRFTKDAIDLTSDRYQFFSFDRSGQSGQFTHAREAERGVRRSTPDTLLEVGDYPDIWWEAKDGNNEPSREQYQMLEKLRSLGRYAGWGNSVALYGRFLNVCGVPLKHNWVYQATVLDGFVQSRIAAKELRRDGIAKRARSPKGAPRNQAGTAFVRRANKAGILM